MGLAATCSIVLAMYTPALAQENPMRTPTKDPIDLRSNKLVFKGDRSAWDRYHGKLDRLVFEGTGHVNIVHVGGSHIQADMWTAELRERMQTVVPGVRGGRGFIFPYNMAKSNNPYWYKPDFTGSWTSVKNTARTGTDELGIAGYMVTTHNPNTRLDVGFRGGVYPAYSFNRVKVFHRMDSSFTVEAWSADARMRINTTVQREKGYTEINYDRYVDTLHLRFTRTDSTQRQFTLKGISLETDDPGIFYHAVGVNGASTSSWLRCLQFSEELALLKPDLVVFSIGINDAHDPNFSSDRYLRNYEQLISQVAEAAPNAAILLTTNTDSYIKRRYPNKNGSAVRDVMFELSRRHGCAVWDTFGVMGGLGAIAQWERAGLAQKDRVHLNRAGYTALGDLLFTAMMEAYGDHLRSTYRP